MESNFFFLILILDKIQSLANNPCDYFKIPREFILSLILWQKAMFFIQTKSRPTKLCVQECFCLHIEK